MSFKLLISIVLLKIGCTLTSYLEEEHRRPKIDRTNIVNKGVWVRNKDTFEGKPSYGNFIFRGNSIDVDNILQGDFNAFDDSNAQNGPYISSYVERNKRSPNRHRHRRFRKSLTNCDTKGNCESENNIDSSLVKSKLITKLKPSTVFNDYPYEIAMLLANSKDQAQNYTYLVNEAKANENETLIDIKNVSIESVVQEIYKDANGTNNTDSVLPKRSMRDESRVIKKKELFEEVVTSTDSSYSSKLDRNVFEKESGWHQNAPIPSIPSYGDRYKFTIKDNNKESKVITEKSLIKVLAMLTKTFKKIMRQHDNIKDIHKKLYNMNAGFLKNIDVMSEKFLDFDSKYMALVKFNEKVKLLEDKIDSKEKYYKAKEMELSKNLAEFESQQKKFLIQQRQFYNIQKLMLAQNEKINARQNQIAKTQSEISHRQNNFARILKKAKQIYIDNKHLPVKISTAYAKPKNGTEFYKTNDYATYTTSSPQGSESVKINLFSIPSEPNHIENHDHLLLNEKDDQPVDDLVYKYYFNNTFIDNLMKTFLSSFLNTNENTDATRNVKSKRNEVPKMETTILLPVKRDDETIYEGKVLNRERRWIKHHSSKKSKRKNRGKVHDEPSMDDDAKNARGKNCEENFAEAPIKTPTLHKELNVSNKNDPFVLMATNFCNAVGQNSSSQVLDWCVEKALRKLQNIDTKMTVPPSNLPPKPEKKPRREFPNLVVPTNPQTVPPVANNEIQPGSSTKVAPVLSSRVASNMKVLQNTPATILKSSPSKFFPDNDELESNLKEFDIVPDEEGNVYFDGSLHESDLLGKGRDKDSGGSDIMPGLDSSSKIDTMDPQTFDPQGLRRALMSRMKYESMVKKMTRL